jgi:hypothetical protein
MWHFVAVPGIKRAILLHRLSAGSLEHSRRAIRETQFLLVILILLAVAAMVILINPTSRRS